MRKVTTLFLCGGEGGGDVRTPDGQVRLTGHLLNLLKDPVETPCVSRVYCAEGICRFVLL